ncbi:hypothetical protein [Flammeovirga kamogawensis]|uniref:Uncharacterized protein n=1 Tax=Flammeovirga kamogawensis TaxID=373891 RepID=A0ABX8H168_9BACT|nr:hypothetical protein [Flammeovirga kamogawensis]MBB6462274.1 hypothetical protein [Flammeovirga kamogawensis]QWG09332.1 hypothetical protein KM029_22260 [Flammeovirga kamogawensis]TRX64854.1 hypothetical protein EO216_20170 [Flammeovirga kamogawensis]
MLAINHLCGGLTFTATFCAFQDINIFEKPEYLALTSDIDNTKSFLYIFPRFTSSPITKIGRQLGTNGLVP